MTDHIKEARDALDNIYTLLDEEIKARFNCPDRPEKECAGNSVIYRLLSVPRNIAQQALAALDQVQKPVDALATGSQLYQDVMDFLYRLSHRDDEIGKEAECLGSSIEASSGHLQTPVKGCESCEGLGRIDMLPDDGTHTHPCEDCQPEAHAEWLRGYNAAEYERHNDIDQVQKPVDVERLKREINEIIDYDSNKELSRASLKNIAAQTIDYLAASGHIQTPVQHLCKDTINQAEFILQTVAGNSSPANSEAIQRAIDLIKPTPPATERADDV